MDATTTIGMWGNAEAIRLPRAIMRKVGLRKGDRVGLSVTKDGRIEIEKEPEETHRRVIPSRQVTFDDLFRGYEGGRLPDCTDWPEDDLVGAEIRAWSE